MLSALGAASSALDLLKSLTAKKTSGAPTVGPTPAMRTLDFFGSTDNPNSSSSPTAPPKGSPSKSGALSPDLMSALLAALGQTDSSTESSNGTSSSTSPSGASDPFKELFAALDSDGNGKIDKSEFEDKLGAGGTNTANADSVFGKLDKNGDGSVSLDELAAALTDKEPRDRPEEKSGRAKASSDPLTLQGASSTSPAAAGAATSSYNFIEQMIARETKATSSAATGSVSVSA